MNKNTIIKEIDSATLKLKEALSEIDAIDITVDLNTLSSEAFNSYGKDLTTALSKLKKLSMEINPRILKVSDELQRYNASRQLSLDLDVDDNTETYVDKDGSTIVLGFDTVTNERVDRSALDAITGLSINVTGNNLDVYTKASVRARKNKVKEALENGSLPNDKGILITKSYQQGKIVFKNSEGEEVK